MNDICSCGGRFLETDYHTSVCQCCGIERFRGYSPNNMVYSKNRLKSLPTTYSRLARFRDLLRRVFALDSGPKVEDPIWSFLQKHAPFKDCNDIFSGLKQSGLCVKHYGSVHLFTKLFATHYTPHTFTHQHLLHIETVLCRKFENILLKWKLAAVSPAFFSYNWMIEKYLREDGLLYFLKYVKRLQCPHRRLKYSKKLKNLNAVLLGSSSQTFWNGQMTQAVHSLCETTHSNSPRNQSHPDSRSPSGTVFSSEAGSPPFPNGTHAIVWGAALECCVQS